MQVLSSVRSNVSASLSAVVASVSASIGNVRNAITSGMQSISGYMKTLASQARVWGADIINGIASGIRSNMGSLDSAVGAAANTIRSQLHFSVPDEGPLTDYESWMPDFMGGLASGIENGSGTVKMAVANLGAEIAEIFQALPAQAVQWGVDFINGLRDGILSGVGAIVSAVQNVADSIRSYLHFSVPDKGPLKDYESWMPDFTSGLARSFEGGEESILDKIRDLASDISLLTSAATAKATTAASTMVSNRTSSVTQNVNITNAYSGTAVEGARNVTTAMKQSAYDATAYMARGLAYAR